MADSGPGIALAKRERVFDRFFRGTTSHETDGATTGTGLGLAIVREVAQRHKASILLLDGLPGSHGRPGLTARLSFATRNETRMANDFSGRAVTMAQHEEPDGLIGMPVPIGVCQPAPHAILPGVYPALVVPAVALLTKGCVSRCHGAGLVTGAV